MEIELNLSEDKKEIIMKLFNLNRGNAQGGIVLNDRNFAILLMRSILILAILGTFWAGYEGIKGSVNTNSTLPVIDYEMSGGEKLEFEPGSYKVKIESAAPFRLLVNNSLVQSVEETNKEVIPLSWDKGQYFVIEGSNLELKSGTVEVVEGSISVRVINSSKSLVKLQYTGLQIFFGFWLFLSLILAVVVILFLLLRQNMKARLDRKLEK